MRCKITVSPILVASQTLAFLGGGILAWGSFAQAEMIFDDFEDGDFTSNPAWTIANGEFSVDTDTGGTDTSALISVGEAGATSFSEEPPDISGFFEITMND